MSRYIDYDAIDYRNDKMHDKSSDFIDGVIYMAQRIEEAPSIDIVRCKECEYWHKWSDGEMFCGHFDGGIGSDADDFCSYGVRKTNTTAEEKPTPIRDYMVYGERKESE